LLWVFMDRQEKVVGVFVRFRARFSRVVKVQVSEWRFGLWLDSP
jgi:hypothetical protein